MRTHTSRTINFSTKIGLLRIVGRIACISSIALHGTFAIGQTNNPASNPRAETDSRPTEPVPPTAVKPTPTPKQAAVKPTPAAPAAAPGAAPAAASAKPAQMKPVAKPVVKPTPVPTTLELSRKFPKVVTKLMVDDLSNGKGRMTKAGAKLVVHFQSWLYDPTQPLGRGPQFESTQGKAPYKFSLQNPETPHIKGWEEGLVDMKVGGKRRLIIPPDLAYGANGAGQVIPAGATLLYEIELVDVE